MRTMDIKVEANRLEFRNADGRRLGPGELRLFLGETVELRLTVQAGGAPLDFSTAAGVRLAAKDPEDLDAASFLFLSDESDLSDWSDLAAGKLGLELDLNTVELAAFLGNDPQRVELELVETDAGGLPARLLARGPATALRAVITGAEGTPSTATPHLPEQLDFALYAPGNDTVVLSLAAKYAATVQELTVKTAAGTCTLALRRAGVAIGGLSAVAVTADAQTVAASRGNALAAGETLDLVLASVANVTWLYGSVKLQR